MSLHSKDQPVLQESTDFNDQGRDEIRNHCRSATPTEKQTIAPLARREKIIPRYHYPWEKKNRRRPRRYPKCRQPYKASGMLVVILIGVSILMMAILVFYVSVQSGQEDKAVNSVWLMIVAVAVIGGGTVAWFIAAIVNGIMSNY